MGTTNLPRPPGWTAETYRLIEEGNEADFREHFSDILGICLDPMPWGRAVELIREGSVVSLGTLGRHPLGLRTYYRFRRETLEEFASIDNYVKWRVFGWPTVTNAEGKKEVPDPEKKEEVIVWRPNDFPYYLEEGVEHHNIWCSTRALSTQELEQVIERERPAAQYETAFFVNPAPLASIPSLWHAHVLSRPRTT